MVLSVQLALESEHEEADTLALESTRGTGQAVVRTEMENGPHFMHVTMSNSYCVGLGERVPVFCNPLLTVPPLLPLSKTGLTSYDELECNPPSKTDENQLQYQGPGDEDLQRAAHLLQGWNHSVQA